MLLFFYDNKYCYPGRPRHHHNFDIHSFIHIESHPLPPIALQRRQAQTVRHWASNILHVLFKGILYLKGYQIASLVKELQQFCWMDGFCLLAELHRKGSAINRPTPSSFNLWIWNKAALPLICRVEQPDVINFFVPIHSNRVEATSYTCPWISCLLELSLI